MKDLLNPAPDSTAQPGQKSSPFQLTFLNNSQSEANILLETETPGPDKLLKPGEEREVSGQAPPGAKLKIYALKGNQELDSLNIAPPAAGKDWWVVLGQEHKLRLADQKPGKKRPGPVKADIGPEGGSLALADGTRLVVPPGAFTGPTPVTMRNVPDSSGLLAPEPGLKRRVLELTAPVAKFKKPVQIRIPLRAEDKPSEPDRFLVGVLDEKQNCLHMMPVGVVKTEKGHELVITTDHFCFFFIDWILGETPPPTAGPIRAPIYKQGDSLYCWAACMETIMKAAGVLPATAKRGIYSTVGHVGHAPGGSSTFSIRWNEAMGEEVRQRISVPPVRRIWGGGLYGLYVITTNTPLNGPMIRYIKCRIGSMKIPLLLAASRMQDKQAQKPGHQVVLLGYDDKGNWTVHNPSMASKEQGYTKMTNSELDLNFAMPGRSFYVTMYICKQLPKKNPLVSLSLPNLSFWFEGKAETGGEKPGKEDDYVEDKKWYAQFFWDWLNRSGPGYRFAKVKDLEFASSANPKDTYKAIPGTADKLVMGDNQNGGLVVINSSPDDSSPPVQAVVSVEFKNLDRPKDKPLVVKAEHSLIPRKKRRARFEVPVNTTKKEKGLRDPKIQQKPWKYSMLAQVADKASGAVLDQKEIHFVLEPMPKEEGKLPVKFGDPPPAPAQKHTFKLKAATQKPQALAPGLSAEQGSVLKKIWKLAPTAVEPIGDVKPSQLPFRTIRLKRVSGNEKLPVLADVVTPGKAQVPAGAGSRASGPEAKNRHDRLGVLQKAGDELYAKITLDQWLELSAERAVKDLNADLEAVVEASQACLLSAWPWRSRRPDPLPKRTPINGKPTGQGEIDHMWHAKGFNLPPGKTLKWQQGFFTGPGQKGKTVAERGTVKIPADGSFYGYFGMYRAKGPKSEINYRPYMFLEILDPDPKAKKPLAVYWD